MIFFSDPCLIIYLYTWLQRTKVYQQESLVALSAHLCTAVNLSKVFSSVEMVPIDFNPGKCKPKSINKRKRISSHRFFGNTCFLFRQENARAWNSGEIERKGKRPYICILSCMGDPSCKSYIYIYI
jgi:hypothetical protein